MLQDWSFLLFQMLPISIDKQKKHPPLFKFSLTDGWAGAGGRRGQTCQTEIYYRIVYFYCFKCFGLILKSKGNASLFSNVVWQRRCPQFSILFFETQKHLFCSIKTDQKKYFLFLLYFQNIANMEN